MWISSEAEPNWRPHRWHIGRLGRPRPAGPTMVSRPMDAMLCRASKPRAKVLERARRQQARLAVWGCVRVGLAQETKFHLLVGYA
eukprot:3021484-Prymnesium_polylepis.1